MIDTVGAQFLKAVQASRFLSALSSHHRMLNSYNHVTGEFDSDRLARFHGVCHLLCFLFFLFLLVSLIAQSHSSCIRSGSHTSLAYGADWQWPEEDPADSIPLSRYAVSEGLGGDSSHI